MSTGEAGASLGAYLRALRRAAGVTLREVTARCGVSNGYVSLLEHDRVREPSPKVLHTLACCYGADYAELLRRAGYPVPGEAGTAPPPSVAFAGAERLTPEERDEIQEIIAMKLRRRRAAPAS